ILHEEKDPFVQRAVRLANQMDSIKVPWDTKLFQDEFRQGTPQEKLEQTTMMFLLRLVTLVKEEMHIRTFRKPESHEAVQAWISLLKHTLFAALTLLYNVRWTMAEAMDMRDASSYPDIDMAKKIWRELITEPLYRLLRCGICMTHMRHIMQEMKSKLMDKSTQYQLIWFNIHNKVTARKMYHTATQSQNVYSESELDKDSTFMHQGLSS
ncbi:sulfhydryl oxidase, partial [Trichonephila clavipes]